MRSFVGPLGLLGLGLLGLLGGCGAIRDVERHALFQPEHAAGHARHAAADGVERWTLAISGGEVEALYLPPEGATRGARSPAIIVAHGNAELADDWVERVTPYRRMGLAVLIPEYRGYGRSGGAPSEEAIVADFVRFYDRLVRRPDIDVERVAMHGYSLGGAVVAQLSARRRARALVLESTFTSMSDLVSQWFVPRFAVSDPFDTRAVMSESSTPLLILHGVADPLVPFRHALELHRVARDSRLVAFDAHHDDMPRGAVYWSTIRAFLKDVGVIDRSALGARARRSHVP